MKKTFFFLTALGALVTVIIVLLPFVYLAPSRSFHEVSISAPDYAIEGYLSEGRSEDGPWIVFVHGNREVGQNHVLYHSITQNLDGDATVLAIDMRGFGKSSSQGLEGAANILDRHEDIEAAISYLQRDFGAHDDQIILIGHSLGSLQILNAGKNHRYRLLVPIGPADFGAFLGDRQQLDDYARKLERNTGIQLTPARIFREGSRLAPEGLFFPCPVTPIAFVFGTNDLGESLLNHQDRVPDACKSHMDWITIPFADHVYGTETERFPEPLQSIYSAITRSLLIWRLNRLID